MALEFTTSHLSDSLSLFRYYKYLAERAMAQVADEDLFLASDEQSNSIAIVAKHMAGNMRSRWTDFLTSDGEKPDRNRDSEFENPPKNRQELMRLWEESWARVFNALKPLNDSQLSKRVMIRVRSFQLHPGHITNEHRLHLRVDLVICNLKVLGSEIGSSGHNPPTGKGHSETHLLDCNLRRFPTAMHLA